MRRILIAAIALALAAPAVAQQLYKWVDKDGKVHYSDTPPANQDTKQLNVGSGSTSAPAPAKGGYVQKEKDAQKGRETQADAGKKADDEAKVAAQKAENCTRARQAYQTYADGGRIHKYNDKGERVMLEDFEIKVELDKAQQNMDEACKKT